MPTWIEQDQGFNWVFDDAAEPFGPPQGGWPQGHKKTIR